MQFYREGQHFPRKKAVAASFFERKVLSDCPKCIRLFQLVFMNPLRAASVQFQHLPGNKEANLATVRGFVARAAAEQVDLLVFPEMCITGYWHVRNLSREEIDGLAEPVPSGPSTDALLALASEHGMTIGAGLIERGEDGKLYNAYVVAMPDGRTVCHRKLHTFISEHMDSGSD